MTKRNHQDNKNTFGNKTITLYERVDGRKLRYILEHHEKFNLKELLHSFNPNTPQTRSAQVTILENYLKRIKGGKVKVEYKQNANIGRHFAKHGLSLQNIERSVRHTICKEFYIDVDIVNAHPVFLDQYLTKAGIDHPHLKYYIDNRDALFDHMAITTLEMSLKRWC
jgi:hypothetical protein